MQNFLLKEGDQLAVPLHFSPQGDFVYPFSMINSFGEDTDLVVSIVVDEKVKKSESIRFESVTFKKDLSFSLSNQEESKNTRVTFLLKTGHVVNLFLPASPKAVQKIETVPCELTDVQDRINLEIDLAEKDEETLLRPFMPSEGKPTPKVIDENHIESLIHNRFFKGFISLREAQQQLDYVIYNKLFAPDGSKGLLKWKRAVYRKFVRGVYRRLTKNSHRKQYFAKLYRNYINNNVISENIHD
ncbi:MAG: hypothetical protein JSS98_05380 [Bacteroidetes bacterium]|nr:hypothetical protein [Bacteroidota bacterium]